VGVLAGAIAWVQYRNAIFRPTATSFIEEPGRDRVAIRIINNGGAAGMVERIELVSSAHERKPLTKYHWTEPWEAYPPVPFVLPGKASAILVLHTDRAIAADVRTRIMYGNGRLSKCMGFRGVKGKFREATTLPPESLALRAPPSS
jgi:hypothetical protein